MCLIAVKEANVDEFLNLVNNPAYPSEQRVLRLKELPLECTQKDILKYFSGLYCFHLEIFAFNFAVSINGNFSFFCFVLLGRSVSNVQLIRNDANQFFGEAFVLFGSLEDIELALEGIYGNKIHNKFIKVYRSSKEQFRSYCSAMPFGSTMNLNNGRSASVPDLGKKTLCTLRVNIILIELH